MKIEKQKRNEPQIAKVRKKDTLNKDQKHRRNDHRESSQNNEGLEEKIYLIQRQKQSSNGQRGGQNN